MERGLSERDSDCETALFYARHFVPFNTWNVLRGGAGGGVVDVKTSQQSFKRLTYMVEQQIQIACKQDRTQRDTSMSRLGSWGAETGAAQAEAKTWIKIATSFFPIGEVA